MGLCLSAGLPAGFLVFFGFVGSFGSIDHRLQQFELLPCGAVQTVDFFDHIVGVGGCDPFSEFVPSLFRFGVMYHHFNGGTLSHGSLTSDYIAITSFLRVTGCPLFAAVSAQNIQSQTDQQSHINAEHFSLAGIAHKAFDAGFIDREDLLQKKLLSFRAEISAAKLIFADPCKRFVLVRKLDFFHFKLDKTVLFQDAVAGVPIQNAAIPCDDGIQKTTLGNDVLLKLLFFLKLQRRNFALEFRVNFKLAQFRVGSPFRSFLIYGQWAERSSQTHIVSGNTCRHP